MKNYLKIILCAFVLFSLSLPVISAQAADLPGNADGSIGVDNESVTPNGSGGCDLTDYKRDLGYSESGGKYGTVNSLGYLGKYQFGEGTLKDVGGYADSSYACSQCYQDFSAQFTLDGCGPVTTRAEYLSCGPAQEDAFEKLFTRNLGITQRCQDYIGKQAPVGGCTVSLGGIMGGAHLGGPNGVCRYLESNGEYNPSDGATRISDYVCKFAETRVPNNSGGCSAPGQPGTYGGSSDPAPIGGAGSMPETLTHEEMAQRNFEGLNSSLKYIWVAAFQKMTAELTTFMMTQVQTVGMFFDAKHQLETQRLLQEKVAQAHKDYHPSEQMCMIGTFSRNLMNAERRADVTKTALTNAMLDRALATSDAKTSREGLDQNTKQNALISTFCNKNDNANNNKKLCPDAVDPAQVNADISYTRSIDMPLTLDVDFLDEDVTKDEENIFAFLDYIFMHEKFPWKSKNTTVLYDFIEPYMDMRSTIAIRSVAQNSFAEIIALKTSGADGEGEQVGPFMKALLREFGIADTDIEKMIGENPSYYAQMEILTKTIYQHPEFISNLYDKPTNVKRIQAALTAIKLMQDRDIHDALLRREMLMSMLLELQLRQKQLELINEEITPLNLRPAGTADIAPPTAPDGSTEPTVTTTALVNNNVSDLVPVSNNISNQTAADSSVTANTEPPLMQLPPLIPLAPQVIVMTGDPAVTDQITAAIDKIASTPEGRDLLAQVASQSPDGLIRIIQYPAPEDSGGISSAFILNDHSTVILGEGPQEYNYQYYSPETGSYHPFSIERLIIHELYHHALGHTNNSEEELKEQEEEEKRTGMDPVENEATDATNAYMFKYYSEPPRSYYNGCGPQDTPCPDPTYFEKYPSATMLDTPNPPQMLAPSNPLQVPQLIPRE